MRRIEHTNIVALKYFFYSGGERKVRQWNINFFLLDAVQDEVYLNLVLELVPENMYKIARNHAKAKVSCWFQFILDK